MRDRRNHASPNSAQTEAAAAGALEVQLAGDAYYFGKLYKKPTIGDPIRPVEYEDIRRMRHDIANHMYTINLLLKDGRTEEAAAYAKELNEKTEFQPMLGQCRNPITDAFLYSRSKELEAQGVDVNMNVNVPRIPKVSNIYMVSALGNLLDNAAEAALKCEKPWIKLNAYSSKGYLIIEVTNPTLPNASKPRRIPELPRGVGSHILTEIAETYEGQYTCCEENGVFHATLTLKEDNCDASHSDM